MTTYLAGMDGAIVAIRSRLRGAAPAGLADVDRGGLLEGLAQTVLLDPGGELMPEVSGVLKSLILEAFDLDDQRQAEATVAFMVRIREDLAFASYAWRKGLWGLLSEALSPLAVSLALSRGPAPGDWLPELVAEHTGHSADAFARLLLLNLSRPQQRTVVLLLYRMGVDLANDGFVTEQLASTSGPLSMLTEQWTESVDTWVDDYMSGDGEDTVIPDRV